MLNRLRSHISGNVIGYLALFVALGGTSYAFATGSIDSREIKNNTVRTGDLRNNEVRSRDIRNRTLVGRDHLNNSLGGDQVDEKKLGEVPSATAADNALALGGVPANAFPKVVANAVNVGNNEGGTVLSLVGFGVLRLTTAPTPCDIGNEIVNMEFLNESGGDLDFLFTSPNDLPEPTTYETVGAGAVSPPVLLGDSGPDSAQIRLGSFSNPGHQATIEVFYENLEVGTDTFCRVSAQAVIAG